MKHEIAEWLFRLWSVPGSPQHEWRRSIAPFSQRSPKQTIKTFTKESPNQSQPASGSRRRDHGCGPAIQFWPRGRQQAGIDRRFSCSRVDPDGLIICNVYKDPTFIKNALLGRKLGKQVIMVVEKLEEVRQILQVSKEMASHPSSVCAFVSSRRVRKVGNQRGRKCRSSVCRPPT